MKADKKLFAINCLFDVDHEKTAIAFTIETSEPTEDICEALGKQKELDEFINKIIQIVKPITHELNELSNEFIQNNLFDVTEENAKKLAMLALRKMLKDLEDEGE